MRINCRHRPFSLAARLTFFISLSTTIAFVAFTWIMLHSVKQHFAEQDIRDMQQISMTLENILKNPDESERQKIERLSNVLNSFQNISVLLSNGNNQILYRSPEGPDLLPVSCSSDFSRNLDSGDVFLWSGEQQGNTCRAESGKQHTTYRLIASSVQVPENTKPYTLLIALSIDFHLHYIDELKSNLVMIASVISLMIIFIVLFAVHKGHQPLRNVSLKIKNITSENLNVRLEPEQVPIELEQLVISFNHMIERIEDVFTRQANFSADIAHEIRTPITNLVTQTEIVLSQRRTDKELEEVLYSNLEEYNRMAKMVSDMLFLAQADNNQLIPERRMIDLKSETMKVFEFFEAWAEDQEVSLTFEGNPVLIEGDPLMLRRVINNLLSNAIRYTPRGMAVTVRVSERGEWVDITVENPGSPIPEAHLSRLFDRFYRVDPSRQRKSEGSGIGLAIVKSIVAAHQGKISVVSDTVSTRFTLSFPRLFTS
ncbi:Cu(+)/Ag(+) sensor histidine kinase [Serratia microhaemolytica]|uniref:Cu(+)/Ag(+) sensor histidine kinase n=1 Tax=Serratia microhaemolytica TaxID=2675110 RepID=UPI000FDF4F66|nr:Cu(+)/Ag(+) sensor histidine kinase [Serratia microhaemolytica]